ncbi:MAG: hypothetical protein R2710_23290 [Acidimicrobiales bacterium]
MPIYRPERTALRWVTDNLGFRTLAQLGVPTMTLRYEDFLTRPTQTIRYIAEFAGLSIEDGQLGFLDGNEAKLRTPMHSIAGNPLRFGGADLTLRLDDAWKTQLDPTSRRIVTAITAPVLGHFGYPSAPDPPHHGGASGVGCGLHSAVHHDHTLGSEPSCVLVGVMRDDPTIGRHHTPPRQPLVASQHAPDRPGSAGKAGLGRHFAVGHDVARFRGDENSDHRRLEWCRLRIRHRFAAPTTTAAEPRSRRRPTRLRSV